MKVWDTLINMFRGRPPSRLASRDSSGAKPDAAADPNDRYKHELPPEEPGRRSVDEARRYDIDGTPQIPEVAMTYCRCRSKDHTRMEVWATIQNQSPINICLEKVELCSATTTIDYRLAPSQQRDFKVFDGPKPTTTTDSYSSLYYKDIGTGAYYMMRHTLNFRDDQDGTFSPQAVTKLMALDPQRQRL